MGIRQMMLTVGAKLVAVAERVGDDAAIQNCLDLMHRGDPFRSDVELDVATHDLRFALAWARCGFPQIVMPHRLAASFAATSIAEDLLSTVTIPWPAFAVLVPDGLVHVASRNSKGWCPESIWVFHDPNGALRVSVRSEGQSCITRTIVSLSELARELEPEVFGGDGLAVLENKVLVESHRRSAMVLWRILVGACIEIDRPEHQAARSSSRRSAPRGAPKAWTFRIARDVTVDCRPWVGDFLRGDEGARSSLQRLVRGHHKRQPYGPGSTLRKWIHVEPYWSGPLDAPVAVRTHRVG